MRLTRHVAPRLSHARTLFVSAPVATAVPPPTKAPATEPHNTAPISNQTRWFVSEYKNKQTSVPLDSLSDDQATRYHIHALVSSQSHYDELSRVVVSRARELSRILGPDGFAAVVAKLVDHSLALLQAYASHHVTAGVTRDKKFASAARESEFREARHYAKAVRETYSQLLFEEGHIYGDKGRGLVGDYQLTPLDYENLIKLEKGWNKRDLCDYLFTQFDRTHAPEEATYAMWLARFQLYCGGDPRMWRMAANELYPHHQVYAPHVSGFKSQHRSFRPLLADFMRHSQSFIITNEFNTTLLASVGYYGDLQYLREFIATTWGIGPDHKMVEGFKRPVKGSPSYPSLAVLTSVVQALSYNNEFFDAMGYVNAFCENYGVRVDSRDAKHFWETVFKWVHLVTRFKEPQALAYYLKHAPTKNAANYTSLEEAKKDAGFDYERYLQFISDLQTQRRNTFAQMWQMYAANQRAGGSRFSAKVAQGYYYHLAERLRSDGEVEPVYEFLRWLAARHHEVSIAPASFNARPSTEHHVTSAQREISQVYSMALMQLVEHHARQLMPNYCHEIINQWSLGSGMKRRLMKWYNERKKSHYKRVERERASRIAELRTETAEDDGFLDIM
ncbi:hypothetical protein DICA4_A06502 [Diutina catenulata]